MKKKNELAVDRILECAKAEFAEKALKARLCANVRIARAERLTKKENFGSEFSFLRAYNLTIQSLLLFNRFLIGYSVVAEVARRQSFVL